MIVDNDYQYSRFFLPAILSASYFILLSLPAIITASADAFPASKVSVMDMTLNYIVY